MASIYYKNGTYGYRVSYKNSSGEYKTISHQGYKRPTDAKNAAMEIELKKNQTGISDDEQSSFAEYYDTWINTYKIGFLDKTTESRYKRNLKYIKEFFQDTALKDVKKMDYQKFLNDYGKKHVKHTVRRLNSSVHECIQDAIEDRIIYRDFTRKVVIHGKDSGLGELKYLEEDEMNKIIDLCLEGISYSHITKYEILFGLLTGCRYGEVAGLTWDCVNFDDKYVSIEKAYDYTDQTGFKKTKTKSSIRTITIDDLLVNNLKKLKAEQNEHLLKSGYRNNNDLVFLSNRHVISSDNAVNKELKLMCESIKSKNTITFHGLRHTHASYLISQGVSIEYISKRLGHSDTSITARIYIHFLEAYRIKQEEKTTSVLNNLTKTKMLN